MPSTVKICIEPSSYTNFPSFFLPVYYLNVIYVRMQPSFCLGLSVCLEYHYVRNDCAKGARTSNALSKTISHNQSLTHTQTDRLSQVEKICFFLSRQSGSQESIFYVERPKSGLPISSLMGNKTFCCSIKLSLHMKKNLRDSKFTV